MTDSIESILAATADERAETVVRLATRAFGDGLKAAAWMSKPNRLFAGRAPLALARESAPGCASVCEFLDDLATD